MFTVSKKTHLHHFVLISCMITLKSVVKSLLFYVRKLHSFLKEVSLPFFGKGAQHNYLVKPDQTLENQLTKERTIQDSPNSNRSSPRILWKNPALPASLWRAGTWRHWLTFGSSFFTMLSHTFLRRALSCSMDKCFFLVPGGGASWENLAKTLVWWWWRRGDSSEESSSSLRLFFFTFFNLAAKEQTLKRLLFFSSTGESNKTTLSL